MFYLNIKTIIEFSKKKGNKKEHCYKIQKILCRVIHIIYDGSQFLSTPILLRCIFK